MTQKLFDVKLIHAYKHWRNPESILDDHMARIRKFDTEDFDVNDDDDDGGLERGYTLLDETDLQMCSFPSGK